MSLPRVLSLDAAGELRIEPVEELQRLRINPISLPALSLAPESEERLPTINGDSLEIQVEFPAGIAHPVAVKVRQSPDRTEETSIAYDPTTSLLSIDVSRSSLDPAIRYRSWCLFRPADADDAARAVTRQEAPLAIKPGEPLRLRIFLDRSMLEVFANGRQCLTQRIWPTRTDATGVSIENTGPALSGVVINAWEMAASNRN